MRMIRVLAVAIFLFFLLSFAWIVGVNHGQKSTVSLLLEKETYEELQREAKRNNIEISDLIIIYIEQGLESSR